jgi:hypothetical protein
MKDAGLANLTEKKALLSSQFWRFNGMTPIPAWLW